MGVEDTYMFMVDEEAENEDKHLQNNEDHPSEADEEVSTVHDHGSTIGGSILSLASSGAWPTSYK